MYWYEKFFQGAVIELPQDLAVCNLPFLTFNLGKINSTDIFGIGICRSTSFIGTSYIRKRKRSIVTQYLQYFLNWEFYIFQVDKSEEVKWNFKKKVRSDLHSVRKQKSGNNRIMIFWDCGIQ